MQLTAPMLQNLVCLDGALHKLSCFLLQDLHSEVKNEVNFLYILK